MPLQKPSRFATALGNIRSILKTAGVIPEPWTVEQGLQTANWSVSINPREIRSETNRHVQGHHLHDLVVELVALPDATQPQYRTDDACLLVLALAHKKLASDRTLGGVAVHLDAGDIRWQGRSVVLPLLVVIKTDDDDHTEQSKD